MTHHHPIYIYFYATYAFEYSQIRDARVLFLSVIETTKWVEIGYVQAIFGYSPSSLLEPFSLGQRFLTSVEGQKW